MLDFVKGKRNIVIGSRYACLSSVSELGSDAILNKNMRFIANRREVPLGLLALYLLHKYIDPRTYTGHVTSVETQGWKLVGTSAEAVKPKTK
jgi:hypothetical protein